MRATKRCRSVILVSLAVLGLSAPSSYAQTFYPDDPLEKEPPPLPVMEPEPRALSELLEWVSNQFGAPGERQPVRRRRRRWWRSPQPA